MLFGSVDGVRGSTAGQASRLARALKAAGIVAIDANGAPRGGDILVQEVEAWRQREIDEIGKLPTDQKVDRMLALIGVLSALVVGGLSFADPL